MGFVVKVPGKGGKVRQYVKYRDIDGKWKQRASGQDTRELAKKYLARIEARVADGLPGIPKDRIHRGMAKPEPPLTLGDLIDKFHREYARPRLKDADGYRAAAKVELGRLPEDWRKRAAASITQEQVAELRDQLGRAGAKGEGAAAYKPNTINGTLRVLSTVYGWGMRKKLVPSNPCKGVERHATESLLEYFGESDPHESDRLLAEALARCWGLGEAGGGGQLPPVLYPLIATALYTGMRKGELFAWRWQDMDLETRRHDITRAVKHDGKTVGLPKSGKPRHLRLPLLLVPILRRWRGMCPQTPEGLVFPISTEKWDRSADRLTRLEQDAAGAGDAARDARKMLRRMTSATPTSCRMGRHDDDVHLADLVALAGCRPSAVGRNWHKARHTFASRYMASGGDLFVLQKILGHATIQMTMIYAHLSPRHLGDEMDRVAYPAAAAPAEVVDLGAERDKRRR